MKILFLMGNPRKNGLSQRLADIVKEGASSRGAQVESADLTAPGIGFCRGCFSCVASGGKCVQKDGMEEIIDALKGADLAVCVSPVYFYGMSANMKVFFDRLFPMLGGAPGCFTGMGESEGSPLRGKKLATISVALGRLRVFEPLTASYAAISASTGMDWIADVRRGESAYFLENFGESRRIEKILSAFGRLGEEFARGEASPETVAQAQLELTENDESFSKRAALFWRRFGAGKREL